MAAQAGAGGAGAGATQQATAADDDARLLRERSVDDLLRHHHRLDCARVPSLLERLVQRHPDARVRVAVPLGRGQCELPLRLVEHSGVRHSSLCDQRKLDSSVSFRAARTGLLVTYRGLRHSLFRHEQTSLALSVPRLTPKQELVLGVSTKQQECLLQNRSQLLVQRGFCLVVPEALVLRLIWVRCFEVLVILFVVEVELL